ncbi:calcium-activated chloride channel regulator 1-like isoform X2 [Panulirus ornatus]|uniref:calcium-activated chloride channel regulator 1-like isoform X2 n=1 Tax=Panulirus ornatus TaxID=150431 RepID=UPI003A8546E2
MKDPEQDKCCLHLCDPLSTTTTTTTSSIFSSPPATRGNTRSSLPSSRVVLLIAPLALLTIMVPQVEAQASSKMPEPRGTNYHHKREHWYAGLEEEPQLRIESSVRTIPSQSSGWRNERKKSYGSSFLSSKWQETVRTTHNSPQKTVSEHDPATVRDEDNLTDRQKRTQTEHSTETSSQVSHHLALKDGGYEGLVVEVSGKVPQDDCRTVIDGLQIVLQAWSRALHGATEGLTFLRSATVVLPAHWSIRACHPPISGDPPPLPTQTPHLQVATPHPVFGDSPWTQQSGGCGQQGDFIQFGVGFLEAANASADHAARAASVLVGEWAKYRWGLFSEAGYQGDQLYLPWYRQGPRWAATLCTDARPGPPACHPDHAHHCAWPPEAHRNATSSLLALPHLLQVTKFCDTQTHNKEAPTKQNALCGGRSAWEVMRKLPDFRAQRSPSRPVPPRPPQLHFIRQPTQRFVLLVEDTAVMNVQRRWEFVRKAVRRVVVYDLPNGAQVAVVVFNANDREAAPLSTVLESTISDLRERVGSSLPRNPSNVRESQACVACGIKRAVRVLEEGGAPSQAANIVLVTSGGDGRESEAEEVRQLVQRYGLRLLLVLYPLAERPGLPAPPHALVPVARESGGRVFTVMDEGVGIDSKVSMLVALMEALTAAVAAGGATTPVLIHSATYQGGIASLSTGAFSLDDSLAANARFAVYYYDLNHVGNTIHLTAPSGATFASVNMQEEDGDVNMISVNLHNAERGVWRYKVENRADSHQALHIQVTSLPSSASDVSVRVWTSQDRDDVIRADQHKPIIIYGEIKMGGAAVMDAAVMATLQRLGTNATGGTYPPVRVPLLDLGTGDPDITRGDAVYTRYAPPLDGPARYAVLLSVDAGKAVLALAQTHARDHDLRHHRHAYTKELAFGGFEDDRAWASPSCCGTVVPFAHTREAPPFTRQVTGPTLDIREAHIINREKIPPSRIMDLVAWVNHSSGRVVLDWTAVGEDRDWGRATLYEGYVAPTKSQAALKCSGERIRGLPAPAPATTKERAALAITVHEKKVLWVCLRAVDKQGNKGPPSNPAALWLPRPPATDQVTIRARGPGPGGYGSNANIVASEKAAVISGCVGGLLLVVVLVATYCYCLPSTLKRRLNRRRQPPEDPEKAATSLVNGGSVVVRSSSRGSVLLNPDPETSRQDTTELNGSPPEERRATVENPESQSPPCEAMHVEQVTPSLPRRDGDGEEMIGRRGLSMSIPDVTKVERSSREAEERPSMPSVPTPQFYTLGRHTRAANRSPLRGPNGHIYGSSDLSYQQQQQQQQQQQHPVRYGSVGGAPQYFSVVRPHHMPMSQEPYSDDDAHYSDQLLCDDRGASPPPPAPADPTHTYSDLHRHSAAALL